MTTLCLYFQVHQPCRLRHYTVFDIDHEHFYEDTNTIRRTINTIADTCYLPANAAILDLIERSQGKFRIAFSLSGTVIDQLDNYRPDCLESFIRLAATGAVEFLGETYHHSLAFLFSKKEFRKQVIQHRKRIEAVFGQTPRSFCHTGLIYNNDLAKIVEKMGYGAILAEGADAMLGRRSPNFAYRPAGCEKLTLLLRNHLLSDDAAFRFRNVHGDGDTLRVEKFADSLRGIDDPGAVINLIMDYATLARNPQQDTGGFHFLANILDASTRHPAFRLQTPAEAVASSPCVAPLDVPEFISCAGANRNLSPWLGNAMQQDAATALYKMEKAVHQCGDVSLLNAWRMLQTSDHFILMDTNGLDQGDAHEAFNPNESAYDVYINYMNILDDLASSIKRAGSPARKITGKRGRN